MRSTKKPTLLALLLLGLPLACTLAPGGGEEGPAQLSLRRADPLAAVSLGQGEERVLRFRGRLPLAGSPREPLALAGALLERHGPALGARPELDFEFVRTTRVGREGQGVVHRLRRLEQGLAVEGGELIVGQDLTGAVTFLRHAHPAALPVRARSPLSGAAALARASAGILSLHRAWIDEQVWVRGDREHPGWHEAYRVGLHHEPGAAPLSAFRWVAVESGEIVREQDRLVHAGPPCVPCDATVEAGCGRLFFRSPPEALDDPSVRNADDVDAALSDCQLSNLTSSTRLDGTWANTVPTGGPSARVSPPYDALRSVNQRAVDEVNAYFHADRARRQLEALGFPAVMDYSLGIDAHDDQVGNNAYYDPQSREMHFGESGVDYAQDADVIYHEYGHAIQDDMVPGWGRSYEAGALGEGFGDYWAAGITDDAYATVLGPACGGAWVTTGWNPYDGSVGSGCLRRVDGTLRFPEDQLWEVHDDGRIWSGAIWPLRLALGQAVADPIVVASHAYLGSGPDYVDAADALLAADRALNGGTNAAAIHQAMFDRGIPRSAAPAVDTDMSAQASYSCENQRVDVSGQQVYEAGHYVECVFTQPGATRIRFHFSRFETELDYDFVRISDGMYNEVQLLSGTPFGQGGGYSAAVDGDTIVARFFADPRVEAWGFAIDGVSFPPMCATDADCDDGLFCTGVETCNALGACRTSALPGLDDGVGCTVDACDEATQVITHTPDDGICSDGRFCNGPESCDAVIGCLPSPGPIDPDDGIPCTDDYCVERTDEIVNLPNHDLCSDGVFCNGAEVCDPSLGCQPGPSNIEDDGVDCTVDVCNEETDAIEHRVDDGLCDDGLFCNGQENCHAVFGCEPGAAPEVDDGVDCTIDRCDEELDAVVNEPDHSACSDDVFCNGAELCDPSGGCGLGEPPALDDGDLCTLDACDEEAGAITHAELERCDPETGEVKKGCGCDGPGESRGGAALALLLLGLALAERRRAEP
ncbi:MAG: M36 family metallopeptidase [Deltaproteobacteria bacterium]|nr:M36 family metallopeptidase [Deltaproteobacteria bacterium]